MTVVLVWSGEGTQIKTGKRPGESWGSLEWCGHSGVLEVAGSTERSGGGAGGWCPTALRGTTGILMP